MNRTFVASKRSRWPRRLGWIALTLSMSAAIAGALVPAALMGWLRAVVPGFAPIWDWLDASLPWLNPLHVIVYAWVAALWRALTAAMPRWRMPLALIVIGALCEALQNFAPGRTPRVSDAASNALGVAIGCALTVLANRLRRQARPPAGAASHA